jgi:hypothetical protein
MSIAMESGESINALNKNITYGGKTQYCKAYRITSNTTNTVTSSDAYLTQLVVCVTGAGTSWTIKVQNKEATPKIVYSATAAVGTYVYSMGGLTLMTSGIDIVTSGTTAGTADVFITYYQ